MTKPRKILLGLTLLCVGGLLLWWRLPSNEPEYRGVPLSTWMARYVLRSQSLGEEQKALAAFRGLGAAAVDYLVMLSEAPTNSPAFVRIESRARRELLGGLVFGTNAVRDRISNVRTTPKLNPAGIKEDAEIALVALRPDAYLLLPHLARAVTNDAPEMAEQLLWLLNSVGTHAEMAEPFFIRALQMDDEETRFEAVLAASNAGLRSKVFVNALMRAAEKTSPANRGGVIWTLQQMGTNRVEALPALLRMLAAETNVDAGMTVARVICDIDATQTNALEFFYHAMSLPDSRPFAVQRLARLSPRPVVPAPVLLEAFQDPQMLRSESGLGALVALAASDAVVQPLLVRALAATNESARVNAAAQLLRLEPNQPEAIATLIAVLQSSAVSQFRAQAGVALLKAGNRASTAIPELQRLLEPPDVPFRNELEKVLQAMQKAQIREAK